MYILTYAYGDIHMYISLYKGCNMCQHVENLILLKNYFKVKHRIKFDYRKYMLK